MVSKSFIAATLLAAGASAAPATLVAREETSQQFTALAARSASPIHFATLNASGGQLWLHGKTNSYCPLKPADRCPKGESTGLVYYTTNGEGSLSMDVVVPGGQRVFVAPDGAIGYTQAHSARMPEGAKTTGFLLEDTGRGYSKLTFEGDGFIACPGKDAQGAWKIFASGASNLKNCLGFSMLASTYKGDSAAWQYN